MSQFPIYESLYNEIHSNGNTIIMNEENEKFIQDQVKTLDINGREVFYGIIRKDEFIQGKSSSEYSFKQMKHGIRIDFDKLTPHTKTMLYAFLKRHEKNLKEIQNESFTSIK